MIRYNLIYMIILGLSVPYLGFCGEEEILSLKNQVLQQNTFWSGTVLIEGVVVIGRTVTLTIAPGTTVLFKRVDTNKDGIGDSEIRVLGGIKAEGTTEKPINFKSAETVPSPKDWSYLLIFTSGDQNLIRHCSFSHAFSGVQVHFSSAVIQDCTFANNQEGIRFGRAKISIDHNRFTYNTIGIRFTRMEGPAVISNNEIHQNDVGIFLVPSGQNIMDFFEPGRTGKAWNEGHLAIYANSIFNNHNYNLKLGAKQMWNLKISDNWWGSPTYEEILPTIFDQSRDPELGQAMIQPLFPSPPPSVGPQQ